MDTWRAYGAIHIAQRQTSKEIIADAKLLAQCEWTLSSTSRPPPPNQNKYDPTKWNKNSSLQLKFICVVCFRKLTYMVSVMEAARLTCDSQWLVDLKYVANSQIIFDEVQMQCQSPCNTVW